MAMQSKGWHKEDIKSEVRKTGITLRDLSIQHGLSSNATSQCLYMPLPRANKVIADRIGRTVHELWPQWFDADGNVIPLRRRRAVENAVAQQ